MLGNRLLEEIEPKKVFEYFEQLTKIPRESFHEEQVSEFIEQFGKKLGLHTIREQCNNVIIHKPATPGYENAPTVILQGHMDMVCVKNEDVEFDFTKDTIPLMVKDGFIRTKGTTLGADNGIAVAMMMTILEADDITHPPITALFTTEEEKGMGGVKNLNPKYVKGDMLINIDSEEEGVLFTSCAGGMRTEVIIPIKRADDVEKNENKVYFNIYIKGLKSGHSGMEINQNRANAIKLLGIVLQSVIKHVSIDLFSVSGGEKTNAIAQKAVARISVANSDADRLINAVENIEKIIKNEYISADPNIVIEIKKADNEVDNINVISPFDNKTVKSLINILRVIPFGVQSMSNDIAGLVESSTNPGVLWIDNEEIYIDNLIRSSVQSRLDEISDRIRIIAESFGAKAVSKGGSPVWQHKQNSTIRDIMAKSWKQMYGTDIKIGSIHAGLECGFLIEKLGDIDMVSIGPNLYDVHTPKESMDIASVQRVYRFLLDVLSRIKA